MMPKYIIKLEDPRGTWYMEWTTVSDGPTTWGMSLKEFKNYYLDWYGKKPYQELEKRLTRVEEVGTSALDKRTVKSLIQANRAGHGENHLTKEEIVEWFCIKQAPPPPEIGINYREKRKLHE